MYVYITKSKKTSNFDVTWGIYWYSTVVVRNVKFPFSPLVPIKLNNNKLTSCRQSLKIIQNDTLPKNLWDRDKVTNPCL